MPRGIKGLSNWKHRHVKRFLKEKDFYLYKQKSGSGELWLNERIKATVHLHKLHNRDFYTENEIKAMIDQSGLSKKEWRAWADS